MMPIPDYLMKTLRECKGLKEDDTSRDTEINARSPEYNLELLCAWEFGDRAWADWFIRRMRDLGGKIP